jgi:uncharacterized protein (UPF0335 family)
MASIVAPPFCALGAYPGSRARASSLAAPPPARLPLRDEQSHQKETSMPPHLQVVETEPLPGEEIRQFIERFESLEAQKKDLMEEMKEVMAEAKGRGYDTRILKKIIAIRKRDKDDIAEEEAILELYKQALGMS